MRSWRGILCSARRCSARRCSAALLASTLFGCGPTGADAPKQEAPAKSAASSETTVGYDVRRLRPRDEDPLESMFERMRAQALTEGKQVAVLFSADWCEPCRRLDAELGNLHPEAMIGGVRILELKEEDWQDATRLDEFNGLRKRWYPKTGSYPVLVLLDREGAKVEEMKEAIERLTQDGQEPTLANWFAGAGDARPG